MNNSKLAIVTGALGGIGQAVVETFQVAGYEVLALDKLPKPEALSCHHYLRVDLAELVTSQKYADQVFDEMHRILSSNRFTLSALINNAAIQSLASIADITIEDWRAALDTNLLAPFFLTQRLLRPLERANGCVINIGSVHARLTKPKFVTYATSKAALAGLTRAMAVDVGAKIRINAIEPAAVQTQMLSEGFDGNLEALESLANCHPRGKLGNVEEVAKLALAIASGDIDFLHGSCIGLDGGISGRLHDPD
ncbi:SDR family oxidoreductase [Luminiphilus sp.]|nr:SDR family oxidoreductase [Luminiphilus sp.]MDA9711252.1 SDR family oxidoreductase [Luminiphilus sp.]